MATREEAKQVLAAIMLGYPARFKLSKAQIPATVDLWHRLLSDVREGAALAACHALVASREHPPTISEIRSQALLGGEAGMRPEAGNAWGEVVKSISRWGRDRATREGVPEWSSPAIENSIRAVGGWAHLCKGENQAADRAQFIRHFEGQVEKAVVLVLTGQAEDMPAALRGERKFTMEVLGEFVPHEESGPVVAELVGKIGKNL